MKPCLKIKNTKRARDVKVSKKQVSKQIEQDDFFQLHATFEKLKK